MSWLERVWVPVAVVALCLLVVWSAVAVLKQRTVDTFREIPPKGVGMALKTLDGTTRPRGDVDPVARSHAPAVFVENLQPAVGEDTPMPVQVTLDEINALASAKDTASGRYTDVLVNRGGRGVAVFVHVTQKNGNGAMSQIRLEVPVGDSWGLIGIISDVGMYGVGVHPFLFYPYGAVIGVSPWAGSVPTVCPKRFRVGIATDTDGAGNDLTYSATVLTVL